MKLHASAPASILSRSISALAALTLGAAAVPAQAQNADSATNAVDALKSKFIEFENAEGLRTPVTVLTASANDLAFAVYSILTEGVSTTPGGAPVPYTGGLGSLAQAALNNGGALRHDIAASAPRIVNALIAGSNAEGATATIDSILDAVVHINQANTRTAPALPPAVVGAVIATALNDATDPAAGSKIAQTVVSSNAGAKGVETILINTLRSTANAGNVPSFVEQALSGVTGVTSQATLDAREAAAITVASALSRNPAIAGAVIGGAAELVGSDGGIVTFVAKAITTRGLTADTTAIVASAGASLAGATPANFVGSLLSAGQGVTAAYAPMIAAGALQLAGPANAGIAAAPGYRTSDIVQAAFPPSGTVPTAPAAVIRLVGQLAVGNGATSGSGDSQAAEVVQYFASRATGTPAAMAATQTAIGEAAISATAVSTPNAAAQIAQNIADLEGVRNPSTGLATAEKLAAAFAHAAPTSAAAGSAVAGIVSQTPLTPVGDGNVVSVAAAAVAVKPGAATSIAQQVSALSIVGATGTEQFGLDLSERVSPAYAGLTAAGVAATLGGAPVAGPANTTISQAADLTAKLIASSPALQLRSIIIASQVASAVSLQQVDNIATAVSALYGTTANLKLSAAPVLTYNLARTIETDPGVTTASRVNELGELVASVVSGVVGKSASSAAESAEISAIGAFALKALSAARLPKVDGVSDIPATLATAARDIAGSIAQTIAVSGISSALKSYLLKPTTMMVHGKPVTVLPALEVALERAAGLAQAGQVAAAFNDVNAVLGSGNQIVPGSRPLGTQGNANGQTGAYSIGSVVEAETPAKNI